MSTTGFWFILLALALYGLVHSLLASMKFKTLVERLVGSANYRRFYRLFFNFMAGVTILPVLVLVAWLPDGHLWTIRFPLLLVTIPLQAAGLLGLLVGILQTGAFNFLGLEQIMDPHKSQGTPRLVTSGLYRWVRHPLYACSLLLIWLSPIMTWNGLAFNIGVTLYLTIGTLFEEVKLLKEFGEPYAEYRRNTPMLIPGMKLKR